MSTGRAEPHFLVPSLMRGGARPLVPPAFLGANAAPLEQRGGAVQTPEAVESALWQFDRLLLLLELAGYQGRELVIDAALADERESWDAIHLDVLTSIIDGVFVHEWRLPAEGTRAGAVGLWVEPRTNMVQPFYGGQISSPVDFSGLDYEAPGPTLGFSPGAPGWLIIPLGDGEDERDFAERLAHELKPIEEDLRTSIASAFRGAHTDAEGVPLCGLLGIFHPATWRPSAADAYWQAFSPTLVQLGRRIYDGLLGDGGIGVERFLEQEISEILAPRFSPYGPDPLDSGRHSASERLAETAPRDRLVEFVFSDEAALVNVALALQPVNPPEVVASPLSIAELRVLTWTESLMRLIQAGCIDALEFFGDPLLALPTLQRDLRTLGFTMVEAGEDVLAGKPTGITTEWALREFQVYARMEHVARFVEEKVPYADGLEQDVVPVEWRRNGLSNGRVDRHTLLTLRRWLACGWRCPVVIEAWTMAGKKRGAIFENHDNVWAHDEVTSPKPRFFACDFTGYWDVSGHEQLNAGEQVGARPRFVVGKYSPYSLNDIPFGGPVALPPDHAWSEAELLFEHIGVDFAAAPDPQALTSTFIAVRAVGERECIGFFDVLTAYDRAFISLGPCHWTLGMVKANASREVNLGEQGELPAFFAYVRWKQPEVFARAVEAFALRPIDRWDATGTPSGQTLTAKQRKYTGWLERPNASNEWEELPTGPKPAEEIVNAYRSWHWVHRWQMIGRTFVEWRAACWDFTRIRIRDFLAMEWGATDIERGKETLPGIPTPASGVPVKVGDVFTSDRAVALLHRWHVYRPDKMVSSNKAGDDLRRAYQNATRALPNAPWALPPAQWDNAQEDALIDGIMTRVNAIGGDLQTAMTDVLNWPSDKPIWGWKFVPATVGAVGVERNTFKLYDDDLPPAPDFSIATR